MIDTTIDTTTNFATGQRVRLLTGYRGKSLATHSHRGIANGRQPVPLAIGTEFVVIGRSHTNWNRRQVAARLDGPTTIVKNASGTWCIPTNLLEAVEAADEVAEQNQPAATAKAKESSGDTESDRVG